MLRPVTGAGRAVSGTSGQGLRSAARAHSKQTRWARCYWPAREAGPRVVVVDAYDSFTFNLVQILLQLGAVVDVLACDRVTPAEVLSLGRADGRPPTHWVLSPGPGRPEDAGIVTALARDGVADEIPLLGVCLGHQALCQVHGARVVSAPRIMHGKVSTIAHDGTGLFAEIPKKFRATRYHSLTVAPESLPPQLRPVAFADDGTLMAVAHAHRAAFGVQFHPESVLTEYGPALLQRFLAQGKPA